MNSFYLLILIIKKAAVTMILLIDYNSFFSMEAAGVEPASEHIAI